MMNLQIVSAVPKLHFSANSYLSDENHSAVTKALASSGCYISNGIFPQRLSRSSLGVEIWIIPSILLQLVQLQLLLGSCVLLCCKLGMCVGMTAAAGASLWEGTKAKCSVWDSQEIQSVTGDGGAGEGPMWMLRRVWLGQDRLGKQ